MYRLSIFVLQFLILIIALTFIFTNPFIVSLDIGNLKYSFSSNLFAVVFFIFYFSIISGALFIFPIKTFTR